ncbi:hypothetical protein WJX74_002700 [Apatococcus lobatus]|uniref:Tudor domain-containing protein n=1 Tax=Apatococcus lobatus TaxID=904363 RepID=A0AAW1RZL3_9CHLO
MWSAVSRVFNSDRKLTNGSYLIRKIWEHHIGPLAEPVTDIPIEMTADGICAQSVPVSGASGDRSACNVAKEVTAEDVVGQSISIWWPLDQAWYTGVVRSYNSSQGKHTVQYTDGDVEQLNLFNETWQLLETPPAGMAAPVTLPLPPPPQAPLHSVLQQPSDAARKHPQMAVSAGFNPHAQHSCDAGQLAARTPDATESSSAQIHPHMQQNGVQQVAASAQMPSDHMPSTYVVCPASCCPQNTQHNNSAPVAAKMQKDRLMDAGSAPVDTHAAQHLGASEIKHTPTLPHEHRVETGPAATDGDQPGPEAALQESPSEALRQGTDPGNPSIYGKANGVAFSSNRRAGMSDSMPPAFGNSRDLQKPSMTDERRTDPSHCASAQHSGQAPMGTSAGKQTHHLAEPAAIKLAQIPVARKLSSSSGAADGQTLTGSIGTQMESAKQPGTLRLGGSSAAARELPHAASGGGPVDAEAHRLRGSFEAARCDSHAATDEVGTRKTRGPGKGWRKGTRGMIGGRGSLSQGSLSQRGRGGRYSKATAALTPASAALSPGRLAVHTALRGLQTTEMLANLHQHSLKTEDGSANPGAKEAVLQNGPSGHKGYAPHDAALDAPHESGYEEGSRGQESPGLPPGFARPSGHSSARNADDLLANEFSGHAKSSVLSTLQPDLTHPVQHSQAMWPHVVSSNVHDSTHWVAADKQLGAQTKADMLSWAQCKQPQPAQQCMPACTAGPQPHDPDEAPSRPSNGPEATGFLSRDLMDPSSDEDWACSPDKGVQSPQRQTLGGSLKGTRRGVARGRRGGRRGRGRWRGRWRGRGGQGHGRHIINAGRSTTPSMAGEDLLLPMMNPSKSPLPGLGAGLAEPIAHLLEDNSADATVHRPVAAKVSAGPVQQEAGPLSALERESAKPSSMWDEWLLQPQQERSHQNPAGPVEIMQGSNSSSHQLRVWRTADEAGFEVCCLLPGLTIQDIRVKAWPTGRLQIKGQAANTMAATKWGIAPVDLDIKFGKALAMETIQAMMTHSGQLYIYAGCLLPTDRTGRLLPDSSAVPRGAPQLHS